DSSGVARHCSPVGRTAMSRWAWATSIPRKRGVSIASSSLRRRGPSLRHAGSAAPRFAVAWLLAEDGAGGPRLGARGYLPLLLTRSQACAMRQSAILAAG